MLDPITVKDIRHEVHKYLNIILHATSGTSTTEDQSLTNIVPGAVEIKAIPVMHPYGYCSRAPKEKLAVTARVGEHPGARLILGFRDSARADLAIKDGEVCLFNEYGQKIILENGKVLLGDETSDEPVVLGKVIIEMLGKIIDLMVAGQLGLTTSPGNPTAPNPLVTPQLQAIKTQYLTTASTNIVSQETFARRMP